MSSFPELDRFLALYPEALRIAFSGGAEDEHVEGWIRSVLEGIREDDVIVITGGTGGGVPGIATSIAHEFRLPLIGVLPQRGVAYRSPVLAFMDGVDTSVVVSPDRRTCAVVIPPSWSEPSWGDAAPMFVGLADAIVAVGGSWGTAIELAHALKVNTGRVRHGDPPIRIVPAPFRGVANDLAAAGWMDKELYCASFPPAILKHARDASRYLWGLTGQPRYRPKQR